MALPDLAYAGEAWAVLRFRVPQALVDGNAGSGVELGTLALRYTGIDGEPRAIQPQPLRLPVLPAAAFGAVSDDELVLRRVGELEAESIQSRARRAAIDGDWDTVRSLLRKVERLGTDNPWIAAVVLELRTLAERRDQSLFAKATAYSARHMSSRLASREEHLGDADVPQAQYLHRRSSQGKGEPPRTPRN